MIFPSDTLEHLTGSSKGVREVISRLLKLAFEAGSEYRSDLYIEEEGNRIGVWAKEGKVASVGIRIQRGRVHHGMALNAYPTSESFLGIQPCGLPCSPAYLFSGLAQECWKEQFLELGQRLRHLAPGILWAR